MKNENIIYAILIEVFFVANMIFVFAMSAILSYISVDSGFETPLAAQLFQIYSYTVLALPFVSAWILFYPEPYCPEAVLFSSRKTEKAVASYMDACTKKFQQDNPCPKCRSHNVDVDVGTPIFCKDCGYEWGYEI